VACILLHPRTLCRSEVVSRHHSSHHPQLLQLLYTPQTILSLLTANAFAQRADHQQVALLVHVASWIAQFIGHGFAEGRAPAVLDNLLGGNSSSRQTSTYTLTFNHFLAVVLAPFFVHLEILFRLGYRPAMYRQVKNAIGVEIAKFRKIEQDKKRAAGEKVLRN
jgi:2-hydroxy fatty acid dioxygenase